MECGAKEIFSSLLHEFAHGLANARGLSDTSRQGRYHNSRFRLCAEELGLQVKQDGSFGWTQTSLRKKTVKEYEKEIKSIESALSFLPHHREREHRVVPEERRRVHVRCFCGRHLRLLAKFLEDGPIICGKCNTVFGKR